jgi:hypothetical protein
MTATTLTQCYSPLRTGAQHYYNEIAQEVLFEVRLWKAVSYAISTPLSFLTIRDSNSRPSGS